MKTHKFEWPTAAEINKNHAQQKAEIDRARQEELIDQLCKMRSENSVLRQTAAMLFEGCRTAKAWLEDENVAASKTKTLDLVIDSAIETFKEVSR